MKQAGPTVELKLADLVAHPRNERRVCPDCGGSRGRQARTCKPCAGKRHRGAGNPNWRGKSVCPTCGGKKDPGGSQCWACYSKQQRGATHNCYQGKSACPVCGGHKTWNAKTCIKCVERKREKSGRWNPALTDEARAFERSKQPEYREWRNAVFARDKYACQKCGARGYLQAHHLQGYEANPELRLAVSNGLALCQKCHGEVHGRRFAVSREGLGATCPTCGVPTKGYGAGGRCRKCAAQAAKQRRQAERAV